VTHPYRVVVVIPAADRERANRMAAQLSGRVEDLGGFTMGLSATGELPATHYYCSAQVREDTWDAMQGLPPAFPDAVLRGWHDAEFPDPPVGELLTELGLQPVSPEEV